MTASAFSEEPSWTLAAEAFRPVRVPKVYDGIEKTVPSLILAKLESVSSRMIFPDEQKARAIAELSAERLKLVTERSALVLERDKAYLSDKGTLKKAKMRSDATKKIAAKEKEIKKLDEKMRKALDAAYTDTSSLRVAFWESGTKLFERDSGASLAKALLDAKISGLVTGSVEDISGYLLVTASVATGMEGVPAETVTEAGPYDEVESLVSAIALRLLPALARSAPVSIAVRVTPDTATVFLDGRQIHDAAQPVVAYSGEHTLSVSCDGYKSATRTYDFAGSPAYDVAITLEREPAVSVAFETGGSPASLYLHTQPVGETPVKLDVPAFRTVGETDDGTVKTFFVFDPAGAGDGSSIESVIRTNDKPTKARIESARTWFYWSLGALYLSLPVYMISNGMARDKYTAYQDGKIPQTQENVDDINGMIRFTTGAGYVSIGLGASVAFHLFRYILAAEQAVPKETKNKTNDDGER